MNIFNKAHIKTFLFCKPKIRNLELLQYITYSLGLYMNYLLSSYLKTFTWMICLFVVMGCSSPEPQDEKNNETIKDVEEVTPTPELEVVVPEVTPTPEPVVIVPDVPAPEPVVVVPDVPTPEPVVVVPDVPAPKPVVIVPDVPAPEPVVIVPDVPAPEPVVVVPDVPTPEPVVVVPDVPAPEPVVIVPDVPAPKPVVVVPDVPAPKPVVVVPDVPAPKPVVVVPDVPAPKPVVIVPDVPTPEPVVVPEVTPTPELEVVVPEVTPTPELEVVVPEVTPTPELEVVAPEVTPTPELEVVVPEVTPTPELEVVVPEVTPTPELEVVAPEVTPTPELEVVVPEVTPTPELEVVVPEVTPTPELEVVAPEVTPTPELEVVVPEVTPTPELEVVVPEVTPTPELEVVVPEVTPTPELEVVVPEVTPTPELEVVVPEVTPTPELEVVVPEVTPTPELEVVVPEVTPTPELEVVVPEVTPTPEPVVVVPDVPAPVLEVVTIPPVEIQTGPINLEDDLDISRWDKAFDVATAFFEQISDQVRLEKITPKLRGILDKITTTGQHVYEFGEGLYHKLDTYIKERIEDEISERDDLIEISSDFQDEAILVEENKKQEKSEEELEIQDAMSNDNDEVSGSSNNWILNKISIAKRSVINFSEDVESAWKSYLKKEKEEERYNLADYTENVALKTTYHTNIAVPKMSDHIRADVENWVDLSFIDRNQLRIQKQGIIDKYGLSLIPVDLREVVLRIENRETEENVNNWVRLTYEGRRGLKYRGQDIISYHEIFRLPEGLQDLVIETERSDEQKKEEIENQWAQLRERARGLENSLIATENLEMEEYQFLGVKLFPIHSGDNAYRRTRRNNMQLSLAGQDMRLEIHSDVHLINYEVLAEHVQEIQLIMDCPDQPDCKNNIIRFYSGEYWDEYSLDQLIDYNGSTHYIKIIPSQSDEVTEVNWGSTMRSFQGSFRIQLAEQSKNSELLEWSLINDLHIEEYIRSVVPSELPVNSDMDALKAQAIAARSFALYHVVMARTVHSRAWDVSPTTQFQLYLGVEEERLRSDRAIQETRGIVLSYRGRVALTEYFSCTELATNDDVTNPVAKSRNIPSYLLCEDYDHISQYRGHGRGLPQIVMMELTKEGWKSHADNLPTENAVVPENFDEPWSYRDILLYFYHGVSLSHYSNIQSDL